MRSELGAKISPSYFATSDTASQLYRKGANLDTWETIYEVEALRGRLAALLAARRWHPPPCITFDALGLVADSKMRNVATIQSSAVSEVIAATVEAGIEWHAIFAVAKLNPNLVADPDSRIQFSQYLAICERAARLSADDSFGLHPTFDGIFALRKSS